MKAVRELGIGAELGPEGDLLQQAPSGVVETSHKLCVDPFLTSVMAEFKCRATLGCDPSLVIESDPVQIVTMGHHHQTATDEISGAKPQLKGNPKCSFEIFFFIFCSLFHKHIVWDFSETVCDEVFPEAGGAYDRPVHLESARSVRQPGTTSVQGHGQSEACHRLVSTFRGRRQCLSRRPVSIHNGSFNLFQFLNS